MVTDQQVRKYIRLKDTEKTLAIAAAKAGMSEKAARKYRRLGKRPSQVVKERTWPTRKDVTSAAPFISRVPRFVIHKVETSACTPINPIRKSRRLVETIAPDSIATRSALPQ